MSQWGRKREREMSEHENESNTLRVRVVSSNMAATRRGVSAWFVFRVTWKQTSSRRRRQRRRNYWAVKWLMRTGQWARELNSKLGELIHHNLWHVSVWVCQKSKKRLASAGPFCDTVWDIFKLSGPVSWHLLFLRPQANILLLLESRIFDIISGHTNGLD